MTETTALTPGHMATSLDVSSDPFWLSNDSPYDVDVLDTGQFEVTIYKSADRVLHIRAVDVVRMRKAEAKVRLSSLKDYHLPLPMRLDWRDEQLLLAIGNLPTVHALWHAPQ